MVDEAPKVQVSPVSTKVVVKEAPKEEVKAEQQEKPAEDEKHEFAIQP